MSGPGPRFPIRAPMASAPLLSLYSMSERPDADELVDSSGVPRWGNGVTLTPEGCGADFETMDMGCAEGGAYQADTKPIRDLVEDADFDPFQVVGPETCTGFSRKLIDEYRATGFRKLEACWPQRLEYEFWTGTKVPTNPHLASVETEDITPSPGTAMEVCDAIAQLEEGLTDCSCGGQGMLHVSVRVFTLMVTENLIIIPGDNPRGGVAMTKRGTLVVPGVGYTGSPPSGVFVANQEYAYATPMVKVFRGDPVLMPDDLAQAVNRANNQITFYAERPVLYAFDTSCCGVLGVKVSVYGGGGS